MNRANNNTLGASIPRYMSSLLCIMKLSLSCRVFLLACAQNNQAFPVAFLFFIFCAPNQLLIHKRRVQSELRRTKGAVRARICLLCFLRPDVGRIPKGRCAIAALFSTHTGANGNLSSCWSALAARYCSQGIFLYCARTNFITPQRDVIPK